MFILTPIAINSSITFKWTYVCIVTIIMTSLMVSWDPSSFSSDCSNRVPKRQREEGIEASILYYFVRFIFFLHENYFANTMPGNLQVQVSVTTYGTFECMSHDGDIMSWKLYHTKAHQYYYYYYLLYERVWRSWRWFY